MRRGLLILLCFTLGALRAIAHEQGDSPIEIEPEWRGAVAAGNVLLQFQLVDKRTPDKDTVDPAALKRDHEALLHMFVYDSALEEFVHVHPEYKDDLWQVRAPLRVNGKYWAWVQGVLTTDGSEFAAPVRLEITGGKPAHPVRPLSERREGEDGSSRFTLTPGRIRARSEAMPLVTFQRRDGTRPDLKPWLGALAHVVFASADGDAFVHAHASDGRGQHSGHFHGVANDAMKQLEAKLGAARVLMLGVEFPAPMIYRGWAQFHDGDALRTVPFSVKVEPELVFRHQEPSWPATPHRFSPGRALSWNEYKKIERHYTAITSADSTDQAEATRWLAGHVEKETLPALRYLFTHPLSTVTYATFTDPVERRIGDYQTSEDEGAGLRVVWQLYDSLPGEKEKRLLSALLFFDYDFTRRRFAFVSEKDALRVRVEVARRGHGEGFVGLSYSVKTDEKGRVVSLEPGIYIDSKGNIPDPRFSEHLHPDHCAMCHAPRSRVPQDHLELAFDNRFESLPGYRGFLAYLRLRNTDAVTLAAIEKILARPKLSFRPDGLLDAVEARMRKLGLRSE